MSANELAPRMPWAARTLSHQWAALAVVLTGTFMVVLDFFIVNVAMPAMQSDLHAGTGAIEWVIAGYGLTFATFLITAGGDYQYFYHIHKGIPMFQTAIRMGWGDL